MEIIVKKDFSVTDIRDAKMAAAAYKRSKATSRVTNVLDQADIGKTIVLCEDHTRAFATKPVLSKYGYRHLTEYPYVMSSCDYCGVYSRCQAFLRQDLFTKVIRTREEARRDAEYSTMTAR